MTSKTEFSVKVLADSKPYRSGNRITTMELTYPRFIHSEFMTHRTHSRNAASSRAIPMHKSIAAVKESPVIQEFLTYNEPGMQGYAECNERDRIVFDEEIEFLRKTTMQVIEKLAEYGYHKQHLNRYLEPFSWITVIATANAAGWENLLKLRNHPAAEPHFQKLAHMIEDAYDDSVPNAVCLGGWHMPMWDDSLAALPFLDQIKACVGRCARVSYLTHDGVRDPQKDIELHDKLIAEGHWSPLEHIARHSETTTQSGNLGSPWLQYRKTFQKEFSSVR